MSAEAAAAPGLPSGAVGRVGRHTVVYAVGILLGKAVAFLMLPLYTRYMTTADYGVIQLIDMTLEIVAIVAGSRLGAGVFHLYHKEADAARRRTILSSAFVVLASAFLVAGAVSWFGAPLIAHYVLGNESWTRLVRIASVSLAFQSLILIPLAELQLAEQSLVFVGANMAKLVVQVTLNIVLLVQFRWAAQGVVASAMVANIVIGVPLALRFVRRIGLRVSSSAVRDILRLGLPFIGVQLAKFVQTFGDRYFLRVAAGTAEVGVYGLGYQFGFLLAQVGFAPFITAWEPLRFEIGRRPDRDAVFNRVFLVLNVVLFTAGAVIVLFVTDFLRIAVTAPFLPAARVVPVIVVAYVFQSWTGFHNYGLFAAERTGLITLANWIGAGVALAGYMLLIPRWLGMGAAWATLLSLGVSEVVVYLAAQRVHPVAYAWGPTLRLSAIALAVCGVALALPQLPLPASIGIHIGLLAVYLAAVWFGGVLSPEDRGRVRGIRPSPQALIAVFTR